MDDNFTFRNAEPSINRSWHGISIDRSEDFQNTSDSIRANREFDSNETDLSDLHPEKHFEQRISISRGIITEGDREKLRINL
jgi:hypothetical protein